MNGSLKSSRKSINLSFIVGLLAGLAATVFLYALQYVTEAREHTPSLIWGLPMAGFAIAWVYHHYGKGTAGGTALIVDEIHEPREVIPLRMAPLVLIGTVVTHLFGGSAGREGTAVQMAASLAERVGQVSRLDPETRRILLAAGVGAGFGAAIGTPWAGAVFGLEVIRVRQWRWFALFECVIASWIGYFTTVLLGAPHSQYPGVAVPELTVKGLAWIIPAGLVFGLAARVFLWITHQIEARAKRLTIYPPFVTAAAGLLLAVLFFLEGSGRFEGLGIRYIQEALQNQASFRDPACKAFFTALTVGSGFKGGEFIPLVFIGTTLGSALGLVIPLGFALLAAVGFAAVFGAAAATPFACAVMAVEIFGLPITPFVLVGCVVSSYCAGPHRIYHPKIKRPR